MKKNYEKPIIEKVEFDFNEKILSDDLLDTSTGVGDYGDDDLG